MSQVRAPRPKGYNRKPLDAKTTWRELRDDPQLPALTRRRVAHDSQLFLKALEFPFLGLPGLFGVAALALRFFLGLFTEVGNRDPAPEDLVAAKPELGFRFVRNAVAELAQLSDEIVEGHMVHDVDELLYTSLHQ